jgi:hypothetical protein
LAAAELDAADVALLRETDGVDDIVGDARRAVAPGDGADRLANGEVGQVVGLLGDDAHA